ncbi:hydrolase [Enterovibrio paralichthyis]|uniref:hydrolase n=1 Tax=Enterovibrio paralichthyis TaxID=2853805 RepID=UPI001C4674FD|nr:hydrolase [Enterovibrio paralichthyis]MBV7299405.1 hydrolase [Enterovibrio paralichthyis]
MLNLENTGLIVVDIQGKLAKRVADSEATISHCQKLIKGAKALGLPIVWVEQNPEKLGDTAPEIAELLEDIKPIAKFTFNAGEEPDFMEAINQTGRQSWLVCGIEAHICVYQTTAHLHQNGFDLHLVTDCIASRAATNKELAIAKMMQMGISVTGLEMCLYELVKDCRKPEFKDVLGLVR